MYKTGPFVAKKKQAYEACLVEIEEVTEAEKDTKKGQAIYIAPLRPSTVASIKTWRGSRGAGRVGLTQRKGTINFQYSNSEEQKKN